MDLAHRNKVVGQQFAIIGPDTAHFTEALVGEKCELFPEDFELLGLVSQHEFEGDVLVAINQVSIADDLVLGANELPLGEVFVVE